MRHEHVDEIATCPPDPGQATEALKLVFRELNDPFQTAQIASAWDEISCSHAENRILLLARRNGVLIGAIWAQVRAGRVAALWPPGLVASDDAATAISLVGKAVTIAKAAGVRIIHSLLSADQIVQNDWLTRAGFAKLADLLYLACPRAKFLSDRPPGELIFEPLSESSCRTIGQKALARLAAIIERTYEKSLDCPAIQGLRSIQDVIAGYRGAGQFDPSRWFFVRHPQWATDVGCLLLTGHPRDAQAELVYMGVSPEGRRKGWGRKMVRYAQWQAGRMAFGGVLTKELMLAVDAANSPAVSIYRQAGFEIRCQRSVLICALD